MTFVCFIVSVEWDYEWGKSNVVKTGPDRPVQPVRPGTGHSTGPIGCWKPLVHRTGKKALKTGANRCEPSEPVNRWRFLKTGRSRFLAKKNRIFIYFLLYFLYYFPISIKKYKERRTKVMIFSNFLTFQKVNFDFRQTHSLFSLLRQQ
jgi:hypothetical protein